MKKVARSNLFINHFYVGQDISADLKICKQINGVWILWYVCVHVRVFMCVCV